MVKQVPVFVALGVIFWVSGVIAVRVLGDSVFTVGNPLLAVMFVAGFPITWGAGYLAKRVTGIPKAQMMEAVLIMTFTAMFLDGTVFGFAPEIYHENRDSATAAAGWILFGGAAGLVVGWLWTRRD